MEFYQLAGTAALGSRLKRLTDWLAKDADKIYQLYDTQLDPKAFPVFFMLLEKGPATVTQLANSIGQSHAAVSQVVKALTQSDLVNSRKHDTDSRRTLVELTEAGEEVGTHLKQQCEDVAAAVNDTCAQAGIDLWQALDAFEWQLQENSLFDRTRKLHHQRQQQDLHIVAFAEPYSDAFKALNLEWIEKHWQPEAKDLESLENPMMNIIEPGGYIAMALKGDTPIGCCALKRMDTPGHYELAKMAVTESAQGLGIGYRLGQAMIAQAKKRGAQVLYLESNTVLQPAIQLYRKLGFKQVPMRPSPYDRCNIQMELILDEV